VSVRQPLVDTSPTASTSRSSRPICSSSPIRGRCDDRRAASYPERGRAPLSHSKLGPIALLLNAEARINCGAASTPTRPSTQRGPR
jgi:hypothetical protein